MNGYMRIEDDPLNALEVGGAFGPEVVVREDPPVHGERTTSSCYISGADEGRGRWVGWSAMEAGRVDR
jgi:hypothetical protein